MDDMGPPWTAEEFAAALASCDPDTCDGCAPARDERPGYAFLLCEGCRSKRQGAVAALRASRREEA